MKDDLSVQSIAVSLKHPGALANSLDGYKACIGCIYLSGEDHYCDYLTRVGQRRPCKPGADCTVKSVASPAIKRKPTPISLARPVRRKPKTSKVFLKLENSEKIRTMYRAGATDQAIAEEAGCCINSVKAWRKRTGRPGRGRGRRPK